MEALQNGKDPAELAKRYPAGMVNRLAVLHQVAEDLTHRDFIKAQMLVREVLARGSSEGDGGGGGERHEITLLHGTASSVPLPVSGPAPEGKEPGRAEEAAFPEAASASTKVPVQRSQPDGSS